MPDYDKPVRLADACAGFSPAALRRERDKGRLVTFIVAGKEFTTARNVRAMIEACTVKPKAAAPFVERKDELPVHGVTYAQIAQSRLLAKLESAREQAKAETLARRKERHDAKLAQQAAAKAAEPSKPKRPSHAPDR